MDPYYFDDNFNVLISSLLIMFPNDNVSYISYEQIRCQQDGVNPRFCFNMRCYLNLIFPNMWIWGLDANISPFSISAKEFPYRLNHCQLLNGTHFEQFIWNVPINNIFTTKCYWKRLLVMYISLWHFLNSPFS